MKIVVCIKQVPASNDVKFDPVTHNLVRDGQSGRLNPFDKHAIEAALRLKEKAGGAVVLLSMGPDSVAETLRDGLAMGADEAFLLSSRAFAGADTLATGYVLAKAIEKIDADLTLFGRQAVDADTGQVGPIVAEHLGVPQATYASAIRVIDDQHLSVVRDLDSFEQVVEVPLPAVVSVRSELNTPRYETPVEIQRSFDKPLTIWRDTDLVLDEKRLGLAGSPTRVLRIFAPEATSRKHVALPADAEAAADALVALLQENGLV